MDGGPGPRVSGCGEGEAWALPKSAKRSARWEYLGDWGRGGCRSRQVG